MATRGYAYSSASIRHLIYLQRYNAGVLRRMLALLNRTDADIRARLAAADIGPGDSLALNNVLEQVNRLEARLNRDLQAAMRDGASDLASYEAQFTQRLGESVSGVQWAGPTVEQVRAAALSRPFAGVHLAWANIDEHLGELDRRRGRLIRDTIRRGFLEGDGVDEVVRRLIGTRALNYKDGLLQRNRMTVETIVRTSLNHTANVAREEVYKLNASIISGLRWTAVLDGRTSAVCRARDGTIYPVDKGPRPPAHPNCRSTTVPVFKDEPAPQMPSYGEWLKEQDREFIDGVLGKTKARLFLEGNLPLDRFVDNSGREYTLAELMRRDADAFKRAGIT